MGGFYGSVQIRSDDRDSVRSALDQLAQKKQRFLLGPPLDCWIGVYPDGSGQDFGVARSLARRLSGELIAMLVHDDDVFAYEYYRDGRRIDQYNPIPDYFGEAVSEKERRLLRGRPESFAHLASDPEKFTAIRDRLAAQAYDRVVFASELLQEFAEALGIRNAITSYEYLQEHEETDDVEGWDEFIHVPDLSREKARKRRADAAIEDEKQRLIAEGRLLAEHGGLTGFASPSPFCCPSPDGRGFLVAWSSHADPKEEPRSLERHGPPWSAGPTATPWAIGGHVYGLELSPTGRYLAVAHAAGNWKAGLWDLIENRLVADTPQVRAVSGIGFLPDESAMVSVSSHGEEGRVVITPIGGGDAIVITLPHAKLAVAHPSGSALVMVDELNRLLVADTASGQITRTRYVGGRPVPNPLQQQVMSQLQTAMSNVDFDVMERQMRQQQGAMLEMFKKRPLPSRYTSFEQFQESFEQQLEEQIRKMREQFEQRKANPFPTPVECGSEGVFRIRFDPSGEHLAVATMAGMRIYPWQEILDADGDLRRPALAVDVAGNAVDVGRGATLMPGGYVYDLEYDPDRDRFLFAGLDGRVKFLDLASGDSGILLDPPSRPPIHRLALSRDRSALALIAMPDMLSRSQNRRGPIIQFWDYRAINQEWKSDVLRIFRPH
jgi:hypothetical protein